MFIVAVAIRAQTMERHTHFVQVRLHDVGDCRRIAVQFVRRALSGVVRGGAGRSRGAELRMKPDLPNAWVNQARTENVDYKQTRV